MCGYFCIGFTDFIDLMGLLDYKNLLSPNEYENNGKITVKQLQ